MSTTAELSKALMAINVMEIASEVINDNADAYVMLNQAQMLEGKGKDRNIGRYRNSVYAQYKNSLNPVAGLGNVDLKLTGAFFRGMTMRLQTDEIEVQSSDSKEAGLIEKYGGQIYGLNIKNQTIFNEEAFLPDFQAEIENRTGLKFT